MNKLILFVILSIVQIELSAQCYPKKTKTGFIRINMVKDFCADPKGKLNAHKAFKLAAEFIQRRKGNCELTIPKGTYFINSQDSTWQASSIMVLSNCKNVIIKGDPRMNTRIIYANNLHYGGFDNQKKPINSVNAPIKASPGNFFYISNSSNITIKNIELNGNSGGFILGGYTNTHNGQLVAYQLQHSGIAIWNDAKNINIDRLNIHHFGLDGILLNSDISSPKIINISNSIFEYNGRQGFSWTGGNQITVNKCQFNYTGRGKVQDPPMAGVDIEPNIGPNSSCTNGKFTNCQMKENYGHALLNPYSDQMITENVSFDSCKFHDYDGNKIASHQTCAVSVMGKKISFKNSQIWGGFFYGHRAVSQSDATKFFNCDFADESKNNLFTAEPYLVYTEGHSKFMAFEKCTFRVIHPGKRFVFAITNDIDDPSGYITFKGCQFVYEPEHSSAWNSTAVFKGCIFEGNTNFRNLAQKSKAMSSIKWIESSAIIFLGNTNPQTKSTVLVEHQIRWNHLNAISPTKSKDLFSIGTASANKYINMVFDENSTLCLGSSSDASSLHIHQGASLAFKKDAILNCISSNLNVEGQLKLSDESFFMLNKTKINQGYNGIIYIDKFSKPLINYFPPFNLDPSNNAAKIEPISLLQIDGDNSYFNIHKRK